MKIKFFLTVFCVLPIVGLVYAGNSKAQSNVGASPDLPPSIKAALQQSHPSFKPWSRQEYSSRALSTFKQYRANSSPSTIVVDLNKDGVDDAVIDGHEGSRSVLLAIISKGSKFEVVPIRSVDNFVPTQIKDFDGGKVFQGVSHYLLQNMKPQLSERIFTLEFLQRSDENGELLNDGGQIGYFYKNGKFEEQSQPS